MSKIRLWSVMNRLTATEQLLIAAEAGRLNNVRNLITRHAANPYIQDSNGMTALHLAAREGHLSVCEYLIDELNTNSKNTAFKCEQINNQMMDHATKVQRLEYIVENRDKPQLEQKNSLGQTALFLATLMGLNYPDINEYQREFGEAKYNPVITLLVSAGAKISQADIDNCKVRGNYKAAEMLAKSRRDKNCQQCATAKTCTKLKL